MRPGGGLDHEVRAALLRLPQDQLVPRRVRFLHDAQANLVEATSRATRRHRRHERTLDDQQVDARIEAAGQRHGLVEHRGGSEPGLGHREQRGEFFDHVAASVAIAAAAGIRCSTYVAAPRVRGTAYSPAERAPPYSRPMFSRETQALMEAAVDAVIVIDHRGRMLAMNDATRRMFGYSSAELVGRDVSILMPEPHRSAHDGYMARYLETGAAKIIGIGREVTALRKDGSLIPVRLSVGRIPDESPPRFVGLLRDVSAEHEAR